MLKTPKRIWSLLVILAFAITANMLLNDRRTINKPHTLFHYDQAGYTAYLPAVLIYHDLSFSFYDEQNHFRSKEFLNKKIDPPLNKYAVGPSLLLSPFFLVGHWRAGRSDQFPQDGFSKPYKHSMLMGSLLYACLGLLLLRKILHRYFSEPVVALSLLTIALGTNLLYYASLEGFMSHVFSFFLFAACLAAWLRFLETGADRWLWLTGLAAGLILATRIPNALFLLVLLGWGIDSTASIQHRLALLWKHKWAVLVAIFLGLLMLFPQLLYWKSQTGSWWVDIYSGERFFFDQPLFGKILFSFRSGWVIYTPLMVLSLAGMFFLAKKCKAVKWVIPVYFLLHLYLVSCWGTWWYGGSYGMRTMVEAYVPLAFPLAACLQVLLKRLWTRIGFIVVFPLFITLNLIQVHQYAHGIIHHDAMTKAAYKAIFLQTDPAPKVIMDQRDAALVPPNYAEANRNKAYRKQLP